MARATLGQKRDEQDAARYDLVARATLGQQRDERYGAQNHFIHGDNTTFHIWLC